MPWALVEQTPLFIPLDLPPTVRPTPPQIEAEMFVSFAPFHFGRSLGFVQPHSPRTEDVGRPSHDRPRQRPRIGIIGAGVSGVAAAAHIAELGYDCYIFEAGGEESLGGVWTRTNRTSGLQISGHFYQPHRSIRWTCEYPSQPEIVHQIRELWLRFQLQHKTKFHCPVHSLAKVGNQWSVNDGTQGLFDGIIAAVGTCGAARPYDLPGQDLFQGDVVHSTQLNDIDVEGKTVVVVGGGASAVEAMEYAHDRGARSVKVISRVRSILSDASIYC